MSIKIKKLSGERFDLPPDFIIEGEKNNPLFSEKGSQTVPVSFPATAHNRRLLDSAFRLDRAEKPGQAIPAVIESGPAQQRGVMAVNSASPKIISAGIGFDEAEMYSRMSAMQLRDMPVLSDPAYRFTPPGATRDDRIDALLTHLTAVMKEEIEADYFMFPVVLHYDNNGVSEEDQQNGEELKHYRIILNELNTIWQDDNQNPILPSGAIAELKALEHRLLTWYVNSEEVYIDAPKGYGVSPFLKVGKLLEIIFENFGYAIEENPFTSHRQLKKLAVLNNTMDTILTGTLHYSDLMPDITVGEFLESLYNKFGLCWFVDSNTNTVRLRFLKDLLNPSSGTAVDLNRFKTEEPEIFYSPQRQLKLTANREVGKSGFGFTSETLYDTFEAFLKAYNHQFTDMYENDAWIEGLSCIFNTFDTQYFIRENIETAESGKLSSSDFFDWDKKTPGLEYEEIQMGDLCLPFDFYQNIQMLHYGANVKHHYSNVVFDGETPKEEENPAKLAFAFGWGLTDYTASNRYNWFFASQINRDVHGHFLYDPDENKYDISLAINREDGLYNRFWKEYDAFLRHSAQEVTCKLKLSDTQTVNLRMDQVMMLNFQPLVPEQIKFKLNGPGNVSEGRFRTLRLYEPYDLEAEREIPVYARQKYYWKVISTVRVPDVTQPYVEYGFAYGFYRTADGTKHDTRMLFVLPPTDTQFLNQEQTVLTYQTLARVSDSLAYHMTTTITYAPAEIIYP
ncbi:MAG: hypothetical protein LBR86_03950 [Tannerella sp.]|jgi:hypothetical protein|nr:hypothetical protein [Tannerella sp.]